MDELGNLWEMDVDLFNRHLETLQLRHLTVTIFFLESHGSSSEESFESSSPKSPGSASEEASDSPNDSLWDKDIMNC